MARYRSSFGFCATTLELNFWREEDGWQELKLYMRRMVAIIEGLIADERFAVHQYL